MTTKFMTGRMQLIGQELIEYVKHSQENKRSKSDQCFGAGYVKANGKLAFTDFYEALLKAKNAAGEVMHQEKVLSASIPSHDGPAIYVACLASYNKGILFGRWISLEWCTDLEEIKNAIKQILKESPEPDAEEWAIHDSQCLPSFLQGEYESLSDLNDWAEVTANVEDRDAYMLACEDQGRVLTEDEFNSCYFGHHSSPAHFTEEYYEEKGVLSDLPTELAYAIDWERVWESDFDCAGWSAHYANGGYYIFSND